MHTVQVTLSGTGHKRSRGVRRPQKDLKRSHTGQAHASARKRRKKKPGT
jgi:hypothetical protein